MKRHPLRRIAWFAVGALVLGTAGLPAAAAKPGYTVDEAVALALQRAARSVAYLDDSKTTDCMGRDATPIVYRNDRVILRTTQGTKAIKKMVDKALGAVGSPGHALKVHFIQLPQTSLTPSGTAPGSEGADAKIVPIAVVTMDTGDGTILIVDLARYLSLRKRGAPAAPDYFLSPSSGPTGMWPMGDPTATDAELPARDKTIGAGADIWVYDTGLPELADGDRAANMSQYSAYDVETIDAHNPLGIVDHYYAGHELAIGSTIESLALASHVTAIKMTDSRGVATDSSAARRMATTLRDTSPEEWPDLIVNAFGSPVCDLNPAKPGAGLVPLGLQAVMESINLRGTTMVVASAGNRSTSRPFYPAAFDLKFGAVLGVGALDATLDADGDHWTSASRTAPPAWFSNYGTWVQAWAPGMQLVTRHVIGFKFSPSGDLIEGRAVVSGTSFAGPYVAALIAEQMATDSADPFTAWTTVKASGRDCSAAIGGGTAVALTAMDATATTPPVGPSEC